MLAYLEINTGRRLARELRRSGDEASAAALEKLVDHEEAILTDRARNQARNFSEALARLSRTGFSARDLAKASER